MLSGWWQFGYALIMKRYLRIGFATSVAIGVPASASAADGDVGKGRELAIKHCARCHVVGDYNPVGGIDSTPSFQSLARFGDYYARFQTFYERRPHPVFVRMEGVEDRTSPQLGAAAFDVTVDQVDDLLAFIETLRDAD